MRLWLSAQHWWICTKKNMQGKHCLKHFSYCIIGSPSRRSREQQCLQGWVPIRDTNRHSSNSFCWCCCAKDSRNPVATIMLPVPVQSRNEQSIEQLLPCRKNTSTCASSMSCQSCQFMWGSCSNPVHIGHQYWRKGTHAAGKQWPLWDNHSLASFHPRQKVRSMKSFSSAMLKAEKAWAWQTPQTLSWQDSWVADVTVLRIPGILSLQSCWLFQFRAGMSNALNNFCRAGRTNTCVSSMSCESCSLANWCGVHAGSQFAFITSNEQRAHTQMGSNQNSFSQKVQWFVIPWQGHPFHQDSLTKEEWILEVSPGNAGPSSQASLCKYYTLVSFHQYEYVTVCGWIAGFKKLGPPKSHRLPADRV